MTLKDPSKMPATVWNNQRVAIGKDLVFGYVTLTRPADSDQSVWSSIEGLHPHEQREIHRRMDNDPVFPQELRDWMGELPAIKNPHAAGLGAIERFIGLDNIKPSSH